MDHDRIGVLAQIFAESYQLSVARDLPNLSFQPDLHFYLEQKKETIKENMGLSGQVHPDVMDESKEVIRKFNEYLEAPSPSCQA